MLFCCDRLLLAALPNLLVDSLYGGVRCATHRSSRLAIAVMSSVPASTMDRATQIFTTALLYTISNEAVSGIIDQSGSQLLPLIILSALGAAAVAMKMQAIIQGSIAQVKAASSLPQPGLVSALMLFEHLILLSVDVSVQFASNAIGRGAGFCWVAVHVGHRLRGSGRHYSAVGVAQFQPFNFYKRFIHFIWVSLAAGARRRCCLSNFGAAGAGSLLPESWLTVPGAAVPRAACAACVPILLQPHLRLLSSPTKNCTQLFLGTGQRCCCIWCTQLQL